MKKFLLASAGLAALGVASATAADMPRREMPAKAPAYVAPVYSWTGPYIGLNGGYGWGSTDFSAPFAGSADLTGGLIGGTLGYNYQAGQAVFGLETDFGWSGIKGSAACGAGFSCETRNDWLGTVRGRLGYAAGSFMPYVTGGLAYGHVKASVSGVGDSSDTKAGWTLGGGVEAALSGPWSAKLEYLYVDLGDTDAALGSSASFKTNIVRAGINYRF